MRVVERQDFRVVAVRPGLAEMIHNLDRAAPIVQGHAGFAGILPIAAQRHGNHLVAGSKHHHAQDKCLT